MLTDRRLGATADWMRKRTGRSVVAQTRQAAMRVGRVERTLAFDLHVPQGFWLQGTGADQYIRPDERGWWQVLSPNDTIDIGKTPWGRKHALGLDAALACECCPEDTTITFVDGGDCPCLTFGVGVWNAETCTYQIPFELDCECIGIHGGGV